MKKHPNRSVRLSRFGACVRLTVRPMRNVTSCPYVTCVFFSRDINLFDLDRRCTERSVNNISLARVGSVCIHHFRGIWCHYRSLCATPVQVNKQASKSGVWSAAGHGTQRNGKWERWGSWRMRQRRI